MKTTTICFDVDGTLIDSEGEVNWRITDLLRTLSRFKNTRIIVWSGGGAEYAKMTVRRLGIENYVDDYASKNHLGRDSEGNHMFDPALKPDIAIDDIEACELGLLNLIVHEKNSKVYGSPKR